MPLSYVLVQLLCIIMHCGPPVTNGTFLFCSYRNNSFGSVSSLTYTLGGEASTDSVTEHLMTVT